MVTQQGTFALSISQQVGGGDNSNGGRWEFLGRFKLRYGIPSLDQLHLVNSPLAV